MKGKDTAGGRKGQKGRVSAYPLSFRRNIAKQYIEGNKTMVEVATAHGVKRNQEREWVKRFSSELRDPIIVVPMTEDEQREIETLRKQVELLGKKLEYEQMRNFALETMADLAKSELGIDIRKNFGAKQPKE